MSDGSIGRTEPLIRSAGAIERMGSATDRQQRRPTQQDRRDREEPNRKRRRLYDLLFDEIDEIDALEPAQRARIKQNLRAHLAAARAEPPHGAAHPPEQDEEHIANSLIDVPAAAVPVGHDHIVHMAAPTHRHLTPEEVAENAMLARQLRDCLSRRTQTARRVAVYLHLLLTLKGAMRPHTVVEA